MPGVTGGIGAASAGYCASRGATVFVLDRSSDSLDAAMARLSALGDVRPITADVNDRAALEAQIPARRHARPEEVASPIGFLASDEAAYVNGHILNVDGGIIASGILIR